MQGLFPVSKAASQSVPTKLNSILGVPPVSHNNYCPDSSWSYNSSTSETEVTIETTSEKSIRQISSINSETDIQKQAGNPCWLQEINKNRVPGLSGLHKQEGAHGNFPAECKQKNSLGKDQAQDRFKKETKTRIKNCQEGRKPTHSSKNTHSVTDPKAKELRENFAKYSRKRRGKSSKLRNMAFFVPNW